MAPTRRPHADPGGDAAVRVPPAAHSAPCSRACRRQGGSPGLRPHLHRRFPHDEAGLNGQTLDLLDAVRSGDGLAGDVDPDTPMIVRSQRLDDIHRIRMLERGGDDIIAKP